MGKSSVFSVEWRRQDDHHFHVDLPAAPRRWQRARENLTCWGKMYGLRGGALKARVDEVLDVIGLRDRAKERVGKYSGRMKR